ncbi:MAG: phosphatidate cytidylyltransferase [Clostridia bacterium]|nr:phosphatidate cytidylyltransferase [Clostridia bacterium]
MKRIWTGAVITAILVVAFLLREVNLFLFDICIGVFALFASLEVAKLLIKAKKGNLVLPVLLYTSIAYLFLLLGINYNLGLGQLFVGLVLLLLVVFIATYAYIYFAKERTKLRMELDEKDGKVSRYALQSSISTIFNCIYPSVFLLLFVILNHIDSFGSSLSNLTLFQNADLGLVLILFVLITSAFSDIFAYFVGSLFGGKKLCPTISEKKTISGAIGAIIGSVLGCVIFYILACTNGYIANGFAGLGLTLPWFVVIGIFASIITQLGDLFESVLKRRANVKDSGHILPGHGGLMDRVDGITFNLVFVLVLFIILLI